MADIPVFPASAWNPTPGPIPPSVADLNPTESYLRGAQAQQIVGTPALAAAQGLATGLQQGANIEQTQARTALTEAQSQVTSAQAKLAEPLAQAELQERIAQAANLQAEADFRRATQDSAVAQKNADAQKTKAEADTINFQVRKRQLVYGAVDALRDPNVPFDQALDNFDQNLPWALSIGAQPDGKGGVIPDNTVLGTIDDLPALARQRGGDVKKAQDIQNRFRSQAFQSTLISRGAPIGNVSLGTTGKDAYGGSPDESRAPTGNAPYSGANGSTQAIHQATREVVFPGKEGEPNAFGPAFPGTEGTTRSEDYNYESKKAELSGPELYNKRVQDRTLYWESQGLPRNSDENFKRVQEDLKNTTYSDKQEEVFHSLASTSQSLTNENQNARSAFLKIQQLQRKYGIENTFGQGQSVWQVLNKVRSAIDGQPDGADKDSAAKQLSDAQAQLEKLTTLNAVDYVEQKGLGGQVLRSNAERQAFANAFYSTDKSIEDNLSTLESFDGLQAQIAGQAAIHRVARAKGYGFDVAQQAASEYQALNPATILGKINGQDKQVLNPNIDNPYRFSDERFHLGQSQFRKTDGRINAAPPVDMFKIGTRLAQEAESGKIAPAKAADVPDYAPGGAPESLIRRTAQVESSLNPKADAGDRGGKGLMQIVDSTGRAEFKKLGLPGSWDEQKFDPAVNTIVGTSYINYLLPKYNNDVRLAMAAYRVGEGPITKAYNAASRTSDNVNWDLVQHFLPNEIPIPGDKTLPKKAVTSYVNKIMGTPSETIVDAKAATAPQIQAGFESIPEAPARDNARLILSDAGKGEMAKMAAATDLPDVHGTPLGKTVTALLSPAENIPKLFQAANAEAQTPNDQEKFVTGLVSSNSSSGGPSDSSGGPPPSSSSSSSSGGPSTGEGTTGTSVGSSETDNEAYSKSLLQSVADSMPTKLRSMILGAGRNMLFGYDDELGAAMRHAVLNEPWDQALQNARTIKDLSFQEHPWLYRTGEVGGLLGGTGTLKVLSSTARATAGVLGLGAKAAPEVSAGVQTIGDLLPAAKQATTLGSRLKTASKVGAGVGLLQGSGEAEGGFTNRAKGAAVGGVTGGIGGPLLQGAAEATAGITKTAAGLINSAVKSTTGVDLGQGAVDLAEKVMGLVTGKEMPKFSKGQQVINEQIKDLPASKVDEGLNALQASSNKDLSTADVLAPTTTRAIADAVSKNPQGGAALKNAGEKRLFGEASGVGKPKTGGQTDRVKEIVGDYAQPLPRATAYEGAVQALKNHSEDILKGRRDSADKLYADSEKSLPKITETAPRDFTTVGPDGKLVQHAQGDPVEYSVFQSKDVRDAAELPEVSRAIDEVRKNPTLNLQPADASRGYSFNILREALIKLRDGNYEGYNKKLAGQATNVLSKAMENEAPLLEEANAKFFQDTAKLNKFESKAVTQAQKFADSQATKTPEKFGESFFGQNSPEQLKEIYGQLDPVGQRQIRNAFGAYITEQVEKIGANRSGTKGFPDFESNYFGDKVKAIFGEKDGSALLQRLGEEKQINVSAANVIQSGSQTAPRIAQGAAIEGAATPKIGTITKLWHSITGALAFGHNITPMILGNLTKLGDALSAPEVDQAAVKQLLGEISHTLYTGGKPAAVSYLTKIKDAMEAQGLRNKFFDTVHGAILKSVKNGTFDQLAGKFSGELAGQGGVNELNVFKRHQPARITVTPNTP